MAATTPVTAAVDPYATEERRALADVARTFAEQRILPDLPDWERAGLVPRELHLAAAEAGLLGMGFAETVGGSGGSPVDLVVRDEALMVGGATSGLLSALFTHGIACPHIVSAGTPAQIDRWVRPTLRGELLGALAITEPDGGSDVNNLRTTARRDGDHYVVDGAKTYITSGTRADFYTVAVRTGGPGGAGISLVVVERDTPGLTVSGPLEKMGWRCSDTAELAFDGVVVPAENLVGQEGAGFRLIGENFVAERLFMAVQGYATAERCLTLTAQWCRDRTTFGKPLVARQAVRHTLVEMHQRIAFAKAYTRQVAVRSAAGEQVVAEACIAKNGAAEAGEWVARQAVQLHGGLGCMTGTEVERHYRDMKILAIGGGASEVLADLAAKHLGYA